MDPFVGSSQGSGSVYRIHVSPIVIVGSIYLHRYASSLALLWCRGCAEGIAGLALDNRKLLSIFMYMYMYMYVYVCVYIYICMYMLVGMYVCAYVYVHVSVFVYMCAYECIRIRVYMYTCTCTYTSTHA